MRQKMYFLPGTMCNEELWQQTWNQLSHDYEPIHVPIPAGNDINAIISTLDTQLPSKDIHLIGFSLGGYIAAHFVGKYSTRVSKLLIIANSPCQLPKYELAQREQTLVLLKKHTYSGITDRRIQQLIAPGNRQNRSIYESIKRMERNMGLEVLLQQLTATTHRADLSNTFHTIDIPTTFCFGENDVLINRNWFLTITSSNPLVKCIEIPNAGHLLPLEKSTKLVTVINQWEKSYK